jgi:hypothetical protein
MMFFCMKMNDFYINTGVSLAFSKLLACEKNMSIFYVKFFSEVSRFRGRSGLRAIIRYLLKLIVCYSVSELF